MRPDDEIRGGEGPGGDEHVGERLDAYRTGELDAETRGRVEAHLETCGRCREELAALAAWASAVEEGYEERRAAAAHVEPDWAAQRAAIVARTSGRTPPARRPLARWAPQIALVAVAALIVGIVWRENPIEPDDLRRPPGERSAVGAAAGEGQDEGPARDRAQDAGQSSDALERPAEPEPQAGTEPSAGQAAARKPAAPPAADAAREERAAPEAEAARFENLEALADRAAEPAPAPPAADVARFARQARTALGARDTAAARRALALWSDTLGVEGYVAGEPALLADSLQELLEQAE